MKTIEACIVPSVSPVTGDLCTIPHYVHVGDAAMDCHANLDDSKVVIGVGQLVTIDLGFKIRVPAGHVLWLLPRSGLGKKQIIIPNAPGTIDQGYSDNVKVMLHNLTEEPFAIYNNDRVCQMLIVEVPTIRLNVVSELPSIDTNRAGGFGSSGMGEVQKMTKEAWKEASSFRRFDNLMFPDSVIEEATVKPIDTTVSLGDMPVSPTWFADSVSGGTE